YKDDKGEQFTVTRSYEDILNKENIVIETDLKEEKVYHENIKFTATAALGKEKVPLTVQKNGEYIDEIEEDTYEVQLAEGENTIKIKSDYKGLEVAEKYVSHYEKPNLTIKTNLKDETVNNANFSFTAEAFDGNEKIDLKI